MVQLRHYSVLLLLTFQLILLKMILYTMIVLYAPVHPNKREEYPSRVISAVFFSFERTKTFSKLGKEECKTIGVTFLFNCLT